MNKNMNSGILINHTHASIFVYIFVMHSGTRRDNSIQHRKFAILSVPYTFIIQSKISHAKHEHILAKLTSYQPYISMKMNQILYYVFTGEIDLTDRVINSRFSNYILRTGLFKQFSNIDLISCNFLYISYLILTLFTESCTLHCTCLVDNITGVDLEIKLDILKKTLTLMKNSTNGKKKR